DMRAGDTFPPAALFFDGETLWLAEGFQRYAAARKAGREHLLAVIRQGGRREALLHAAGANAKHGLRRTNADKRRAPEMGLSDPEWRDWSDRRIAQHCHVDHKTVAAVRAGG